MTVKKFEDKVPAIKSGAYVAENASIIGDVCIEKGAGIWYNTVVRADLGPVYVGEGSAIEDNSVLHAHVKVGKNCVIGHNVVLNGATVGDGCLIGIGSVILNEAVIGDYSIVGAGSVITKGKQIPPKSLVYGSPAKIIRTLTDEEINFTLETAKLYVELAAKQLDEVK